MKAIVQSAAIDIESLVAEAADRFTDEIKQGRAPSIDEYAAHYPDIATIIRQVFPALAMLDSPSATAGWAPPEGWSSSAGDDNPASSIEHPASCAGLLGDFRILRELGRGGMGVVYEAEQISLGRRVALKVLPFAAMLDRQQLARFKNEARAAATLDHPNIVAIHSVGAERGVHYYAMQLIEGQSLAHVVEQLRNARLPLPPGEGRGEGGLESAIRNPQSEIATQPNAALPTLQAPTSSLPAFSSREYFRTIAQLGIQAAEALDHAHQNGILHRDIKPANLLLECHTPSPLRGGLGRGAGDASHLKLWITDFGLARIEQDAGMTMTGDILGTLRYMSPEQALAKRVVVDHRSDIYSLGVTLYELLTLEPAYAATDRQELLRQIAFEEPRKPRWINTRIPQDLETVVLKSIEKDLADRYATAQELANDLRRFIENRPVVARMPSLAHRARKWARRHTRLAATASAILLLFAVGATVAALLIARERINAEQNAQLAIQALDETLAELLIGDLSPDNPLDKHGKELLRRGMAFYEQYAKQNDVPLADIITYQRLMRTHLHEEAMRVDDAASINEADKAYCRAIQQAELVVAMSPVGTEELARQKVFARLALAQCHNNYATFLSDIGNSTLAGEHFLKARDTYEKVHQGLPQVAEYAHALGVNHYNMGSLETELGDMAKAEGSYRSALPLLEKAVQKESENSQFRAMLAMCEYNLAHLVGGADRIDEAQEFWQLSLSEWRRLAETNPRNSEYRSRVGATLSNLGVLANRRGDLNMAREMLEEALKHQKRALAIEPVYELALKFLETHYRVLGGILTKQNDEAALAALEADRAVSLVPSGNAGSAIGSQTSNEP